MPGPSILVRTQALAPLPGHIEPCASFHNQSFGDCSSKPETCRLRHNMIGKGPLSSSSCVASIAEGGRGTGERRKLAQNRARK